MIKKIRKQIEDNIGKTVHITINGSRNRREEYQGIIEQVYKNIFIIKLESQDIKSISYVDILTNGVEVSFYSQ